MEKHITITNDDQKIAFQDEPSLLALLIKNKVRVDHSCDGMGSCGTCRVFVKSNLKDLPARNEVEQERALDLGFKDDERLSCQLIPFDGLSIEIPEPTEE